MKVYIITEHHCDVCSCLPIDRCYSNKEKAEEYFYRESKDHFHNLTLEEIEVTE